MLRSFAHGDLALRLHDLTVRIENSKTNAAPLYMERGELKREHGDLEGAGKDYEAAAKLAPDWSFVDLCRARLLSNTGKLQESLAMFDAVAQKKDADPAVYVDRARVKLKLGDAKGAAEDFRKGVALAPEPSADVYLEYAQTLAGLERIPEALAAIDHGVAACGPQATLQSYAMDLELQRGNTNAAVGRIDKIIANAMRPEKWWATRADLLASAGNHAEALRSYEETLKSIRRLPPRLQETPHTTALRQRAEAALSNLSSTVKVQ